MTPNSDSLIQSEAITQSKIAKPLLQTNLTQNKMDFRHLYFIEFFGWNCKTYQLDY